MAINWALPIVVVAVTVAAVVVAVTLCSKRPFSPSSSVEEMCPPQMSPAY